MKIIRFDSIPSTNDYVKAHASNGDMIVIAKRQTAGRGTKNRSFDSGEGGLYITKFNRYDDKKLPPDAFLLMRTVAVAVCKTVEWFGITPAIKWPNDVFVNGKKICGILIENTFSGSRLSASIVGIGLNVNNTLPVELREIATTMKEQAKREFSVEEVGERLIKNLTQAYSVEEYKKYIFFFGEKVVLLQGEKRREVRALDVNGQGGLVVEEIDGRITTVSAGEVSLRFN